MVTPRIVSLTEVFITYCQFQMFIYSFGSMSDRVLFGLTVLAWIFDKMQTGLWDPWIMPFSDRRERFRMTASFILYTRTNYLNYPVREIAIIISPKGTMTTFTLHIVCKYDNSLFRFTFFSYIASTLMRISSLSFTLWMVNVWFRLRVLPVLTRYNAKVLFPNIATGSR